MEIRHIRLSPKRGGNGFISSYSINIGSKEAAECGLFDTDKNVVILKIVDPEHRQIIIKPKEYTLTNEILAKVYWFAEQSREFNERLMSTGIYLTDPSHPSILEARVHDDTYFEYLLSLGGETLTDLITLMCIGRDGDANMSLPPEERFMDYWQYLAQCGFFSQGLEEMASQILYNVSLVDYLKKGLTVTGQSPYIS